MTIFFTVMRYLWLMLRARLRIARPSPARWQRAHGKTGRAIYRLSASLGGAFIKVGQVLGARADFFPEEFLAPLRGLHDHVPPRPLAKLRGHLEKQLGRPIAEVFTEIDAEALAAASLAQVHRARLVTGEDVAVKIQYPEARRLFPVDLASLRRAVRIVRWLNKRFDLRALADELAEFVALELDFVREGEATERVRKSLADDASVVVPRVFAEHSSDRLLVLEYVEGEPLSNVPGLRAAGIDLRELAEHVAGVYCKMIFEQGFFHGDPHPGNIFARADGTIALLDFGLAKELPAGFGAGIAAMIVAAVANDGARLLAAARSIGFVVDTDDPAAMVELVKMMLGDYAASEQHFVDLMRSTTIDEVPSHFALIGRVFILLNGVSHTLVPGERVIARAVAGALATQLALQVTPASA